MGTQNAANPVHRDNGYTFRDALKSIDKKDMTYDLKLAKKAVLASVVTTNDYRLSALNTTAKEYSKSALNTNLFYSFFDMLIKEIRQ